jgi:hypothetical protein
VVKDGVNKKQRVDLSESHYFSKDDKGDIGRGAKENETQQSQKYGGTLVEDRLRDTTYHGARFDTFSILQKAVFPEIEQLAPALEVLSCCPQGMVCRLPKGRTQTKGLQAIDRFHCFWCVCEREDDASWAEMTSGRSFFWGHRSTGSRPK